MRARRSLYDFCKFSVQRSAAASQQKRQRAGSGKNAHLDRQEELELRRQLLLRVQAVGEVDSAQATRTT